MVVVDYEANVLWSFRWLVSMTFREWHQERLLKSTNVDPGIGKRVQQNAGEFPSKSTEPHLFRDTPYQQASVYKSVVPIHHGSLPNVQAPFSC